MRCSDSYRSLAMSCSTSFVSMAWLWELHFTLQWGISLFRCRLVPTDSIFWPGSIILYLSLTISKDTLSCILKLMNIEFAALWRSRSSLIHCSNTARLAHNDSVRRSVSYISQQIIFTVNTNPFHPPSPTISDQSVDGTSPSVGGCQSPVACFPSPPCSFNLFQGLSYNVR